MNKFKVQIVENREVALDTFLLKMHLLGKKIRPKPGQFLEVNTGEGVLLNRPFSIHYFYDDKKHIKILYRVIGKGTRNLSRKAVGDYLEFYGPYGSGFSLRKSLKKVAIVAGGIGYAPFAYLIKELLKKIKGIQVTVFYGARNEHEFVEFWRIDNDRLTFKISTDDGSKGYKGFITDLFKKNLEHENNYDLVYACGPLQMMRQVLELCAHYKIRVEASLETMFACGFGVCLGCSTRLKTGEMVKVCKDGPVFKLDQIDWSYFSEK